MGLLTFQTAKEQTHLQTYFCLVGRSPNHPKPMPVLAFWRVPLRLTQRPVQSVYPLHPPVAKQGLSRLYGANTGAEGIAFDGTYR